jgi:hypothetical protein
MCRNNEKGAYMNLKAFIAGVVAGLAVFYVSRMLFGVDLPITALIVTSLAASAMTSAK